MSKRKTIDDAIAIASGKNGYCLSNKYTNMHSKLLWKCNYGHEWLSSMGIVSGGSWCPKCSRNRLKNTIDDAIILAKERGGYCLSDEYIDNTHSMIWKCNYEHEWEASYCSVHNGSWCPYCSGNKRKTIMDACNLAKKMEGQCLSNKYVNNSTKLDFVCKRGHKFAATYSNVSVGKWCSICSRNRLKNTIEDCRILAIKMGGICLSGTYINNNSKLLWKCSSGHTWYSRYRNVISGHWCPYCNKPGGITQNKLANIVEKLLFCEPFQNFRGFGWLTNDKKNKLEVDIWVPKLKLAIEYDGEQHFRPVKFASSMTDEQAKLAFKTIKRNDIRKNKLIAKHKNDVDYFIRFNYKDDITKDNVTRKLLSFGVFKLENRKE